MLAFNHHQFPRPSRQPFADSNCGIRILTRAIAEILEAMPHESSFLISFFQKEVVIMKKIHCNDFAAKPPGGRKNRKSRLVIAGTFCCTRWRVIQPDVNSEKPQIKCLQPNDNS
jgi:hypothetical protein